MGEPRLKHVILVVEPNQRLASLISSVLNREGYSALATTSPEEALEICSQVSHVDLVITNATLTRRDGSSLSLAIIKEHPTARFLYLSPIGKPESSQVLGDRANYFQKPFTLNELVSRTKELLRPRQ